MRNLNGAIVNAEFLEVTSINYAGWTDLFGGGTSGRNNGANYHMPFSTSLHYANYYPAGESYNNLTGTHSQT